MDGPRGCWALGALNCDHVPSCWDLWPELTSWDPANILMGAVSAVSQMESLRSQGILCMSKGESLPCPLFTSPSMPILTGVAVGAKEARFAEADPGSHTHLIHLASILPFTPRCQQQDKLIRSQAPPAQGRWQARGQGEEVQIGWAPAASPELPGAKAFGLQVLVPVDLDQ